MQAMATYTKKMSMRRARATNSMVAMVVVVVWEEVDGLVLCREAWVVRRDGVPERLTISF